MLEEKVYIKINITKNLKFRAQIQRPGKHKFEVTVGGERWKAGEVKELETEILEKCNRAISILMIKYEEIKNG